MTTADNLSSWIDSRMNRAEFAGLIGISASHLTLVLQGKRGVGLDVARKIESATDGEFSALELLDLPVSPRVQSDEEAE